MLGNHCGIWHKREKGGNSCHPCDIVTFSFIYTPRVTTLIHDQVSDGELLRTQESLKGSHLGLLPQGS